MKIPGGPDVLRLADLRALVHQRIGIEPEHQVLVSNGRLLLGDGSEVVAEQDQDIEVETYHLPAAEDTISVRTTFGGEAVDSAHRGDAPVWELKRFLARRFRLAPSRQVLTTLGVDMAEDDALAAYAARDPIVVAAAVTNVDELWPAQLLWVSVSLGGRRGSVLFVVDVRDTFDVLLGKLEKEGMVAEGEDVTFVDETTVFQNWRTFGDYQMTTFAKLWIY